MTEFEKVFTVLIEDADDCDILNLVDSPDNDKFIKIIQKAYNIHNENKTISYLIIFQRENKPALMVMEQKFMKQLYHDYNVSLSPWLKFMGHVIVPVDSFFDNVTPDHIKDLLNNK